jgi:DNA-binding LacI/PurR family transcriptional regulator
VNGAATDLPVTHVRCDEGAGARAAVDHLVALGHRRIGAVLGSGRFVPVQRMIDGYRTAMLAHGLDPDDNLVVQTAFTYDAARLATVQLLDRGVTGLFTSNDLMALGAVAAANDAARRVPGDVSVVGYDGSELSALSSPRLTTLRQPFDEMARVIVDAVRRPLETAEHVVFEPELVVRDSSAPAPAPARSTANQNS